MLSNLLERAGQFVAPDPAVATAAAATAEGETQSTARTGTGTGTPTAGPGGKEAAVVGSAAPSSGGSGGGVSKLLQFVAPDPAVAAAAAGERRSTTTPTSGEAGGVGSAPSSGGSSGSGSRRGFWQIVAPDPNFNFVVPGDDDGNSAQRPPEGDRGGRGSGVSSSPRHTVVSSVPASSPSHTIGPVSTTDDVRKDDGAAIAQDATGSTTGGVTEGISMPPPTTPSTPAMSSLSSTTYHTPPSGSAEEPSPLRALGGSELRSSLDGTGTSEAAASSSSGGSTAFATPSSRAALLEERRRRSHAEVQSRVLAASRRTAEALGSPTAVWERGRAFLQLAASVKPLSAKQCKKFARLLAKDPALATERAANVGFVPDGFNPIHAAAHAGNLGAARILLDFRLPPAAAAGGGADTDGEGGGAPRPPSGVRLVSVGDRELLGRTPLHVASQAGHVDMVRLLKGYHLEEFGTEPVGEDAPVDMIDRTPLGWAVTSVERGARENRTELERELFSPGDWSVCPRTTPGTGGLRSTGGGKGGRRRSALRGTAVREEELPAAEEVQPFELAYAHSDLPGYRVEQEDATSIRCPLTSADDGGEPVDAALFGVFDGHGDGGAASRFVADRLHRCLVETDGWRRATCNSSPDGLDDADTLSSALHDACLAVDELLRGEDLVGGGGTTGVVALVTGSLVLVANVGDSRAVLVEPGVGGGGSGEEPLEAEGCSRTAVGVPLSRDHTPDLPGERERIEAAGLSVVSVTFRRPDGAGDDDLVTLHKIESGDSKLSMSRSFGDFDFKGDADLPAEAQAVVAVPEIVVHERNSSSPSSSSVLVLACDGVWDVMTNDECAAFVSRRLGHGDASSSSSSSREELGELCGELLEECLGRNSRDNMSVVVVTLPSPRRPPPRSSTDDMGGDRVALKLKFDS